ncbi:MAG TPA: TonB-dependent receptor [Steroidobacteraceae bacterium]|nr:TonB-dependent receptor [Steroidobacteraceae bacterium]
MERTALIISTASVLLATGALAAGSGDQAPELDTIEVSATRLRSVQDIDVPASVTTVQLESNRNRAQVNVTEGLAGIPGVTALDRQNYAQDTQLSIRGFGARSTFGVRSLRIYADGIPASMPDGQGQLSHFSMLAGERMQVMRGPFSALYGNSSGGVVQMWSSPGTEDGPTRVRGSYGSFDARSLGAQTLGAVGPVNYNLAASRFETDGYRDHSAAQRDVINARIGFDTGASRDLYLVGNYLDTPEALDPLGLSRADWNANPRQVVPVATQFNTRKSAEQLQGGVVFEQRFAGTQSVHAMGYVGNRKINQVLGIPVNVQANPLHSGGVVDLDNDYRGVDLRWSAHGALFGRPFEATAGVNFDEQDQLRRGYENFQGSTLGVQGKLRRNEDNNVGNADQFAQVWWQFADRWSLLAGVRHSEVNFKSEDHYIVGTNPDDSGSRDYDDTTPVAGLMYRPSDSLRLYFSAGQGFETPTFNELSYRSDGQAGLALNLEPVRSDNYELGAKWHLPAGMQLEAALFRANTKDELAVARNTGGRSSYRNIDSARRQGFEAAAAMPLSHSLQLELSYTWLDATFTSDFLTCVAAGCTVPNVLIPAGSRIPGVAEHQGMARLHWSPGAWSTALEFQGVSALVANDVGTESAPGYGLVNIEAGRDWMFGQTTMRAFARVENLLDHRYIGSVIVNDGNGRYYESGPERSAMLGLQWQWR